MQKGFQMTDNIKTSGTDRERLTVILAKNETFKLEKNVVLDVDEYALMVNLAVKGLAADEALTFKMSRGIMG